MRSEVGLFCSSTFDLSKSKLGLSMVKTTKVFQWWFTPEYRWTKSTACPHQAVRHSYHSSSPDPIKTAVGSPSFFQEPKTWLPVPFRTRQEDASRAACARSFSLGLWSQGSGTLCECASETRFCQGIQMLQWLSSGLVLSWRWCTGA